LDASLVSHARRGDREAFAALIAPLENRLYRTALAIMGNPADAEDAWQNTVLKAFRGVSALREPDYFSTWVTRILLNECKQGLRRRRPWSPVGDLAQVALPEPDAEQAALRDALRQLSGDQRTVVFLRYWLGLPLAELAEVLEVPVPTAKSRLYEALKRLRLMLREEEES
jgi:RNA polymerase sigma-70 factor (ECF subfamily)